MSLGWQVKSLPHAGRLRTCPTTIASGGCGSPADMIVRQHLGTSMGLGIHDGCIDLRKLGLFYLGKKYDIRSQQLQDELILYDSKDLVTHAVCVGMTGSGKTGLGITLLEEAAIDGIPSLVVDPKGDMTNLLLNFPELRPDDFQPWIPADDAGRQDLALAQLAEQRAQQWRDGLGELGPGARSHTAVG